MQYRCRFLYIYIYIQHVYLYIYICTHAHIHVHACISHLPAGSAFDFGKFLDFFRMVSAVHEDAVKTRTKLGAVTC